MSNPPDETDDAATLLSDEENEGLIPSYITLRNEVDAAEQANILEAEDWAFSRRRDVVTAAFLSKLHKCMFGRVWRWAVGDRDSGKNIGVDVQDIAPELRQLVDHCRNRIEKGTYDPDEVATRFYHRLVSIHPYANGNGRHARLATDLLLVSMDRPRFSWGGKNLVDMNETRERYFTALHAADRHDFRSLLEFVRSRKRADICELGWSRINTSSEADEKIEYSKVTRTSTARSEKT